MRCTPGRRLARFATQFERNPGPTKNQYEIPIEDKVKIADETVDGGTSSKSFPPSHDLTARLKHQAAEDLSKRVRDFVAARVLFQDIYDTR